MKFIHTSDLHLGKRMKEFSMLEDQRHMLQQLLNLVEKEQPDVLLIAGDIYDKPVPPAEAVALFDSFVSALAAMDVPMAVSTGNHDSPERMCFGHTLLEEKGLYLSPPYDGGLKHFTQRDMWGAYTLWLMPFLRPGLVRPFLETEITSYQGAIEAALQLEKVDFTARNLLVCHQFVVGASPSESEELSVGGVEQIDGAILMDFDYVALGHIHRPQQVGAAHIRYSGTPMKYSAAEALQEKTITIGVLKEKGDLQLHTQQLQPLRDIRVLTGPFAQLMEQPVTQDYIHAVLTDEQEIPDGAGHLRFKFPYLMSLQYDNSRTKALGIQGYAVEKRDPFALFCDFYLGQNGVEMSQQQCDYVQEKIQEVAEL